MTVLAEILAGLGLLFIGLKAMSSHLQKATGRRVRHLLRSATRSPLVGLLAGCLAGAATQSSNAVAVVCGNLVRGGVFGTRDAIPVVAGGNVGTAVLVFVAAIDFRLVVLYLLAAVGFGFQFRLDRRPAWREWLGVVLGLALVLLGLDFIKQGPGHLDVAAMAPALHVGATPAIGFALGLVAAALSQSSSTPTILVLALLQANVFGLHDAFFIVLGANLGSGLSTFVSSGGLEGTGRQLCYVHVLVKLIGCALLLGAWWILAWTGTDPAQALSKVGHGQAAASVSLLFLALQVAGAVPVSLARGLVERIAIRLSPPSIEDGASRPRYIEERAVEEPATALDLSERECLRLIQLLPTLLPDLDQEVGSTTERLALWRGAAAIVEAVDRFLLDVIGRGAERQTLEIALRQQALIEMIRALQDTLHDFAGTVEGFDKMPQLGFNLSESLRAIVLSLADATEGGPDDFNILIDLTADRSELLNRIRRSLAGTALDMGEDTRRLLLATSLFERATWLVRRIAVALRPHEIDANANAAAAPGAKQEEVHAH